ncbi:MAG: hypothetical protein Q9185_001569 [Variospora sp. 1 TL-2023]
MRSACVISALVAIAAAAPAPTPQLIDIATVDAAPEPVMVSAPFGVTTDKALEKREAFMLKRDGDCAPQPAGSGPVPTPDTDAAFLADSGLQALATNAPTPDGYSLAFSNKDGSLSASKYIALYTLTSFDTLKCASLCDQAPDCEAFNTYIERDPSLDPNANDCANPPSTTNFKCTLWGAPVVAEQATNKGQWRASFKVVITGSNGYNKASPPDPTNGFTGPTGLGGAINAPLYNGVNTYLGNKYYPFSQTQGYTPSTCAVACQAQTGYNSRHPNADGTYATCSFFNAYVLSQNAIPQGLYCSLYSKTWAPSYATNYALRPSLLPDETLLFVQGAVGLYEGEVSDRKYKIPAFQNGHAYLTSHRACYVDDEDPRRNSVAIDLKGIERYEFYAGFLKSSPKVTLFPKSLKKSPFASQSRAASPASVPSRYPSPHTRTTPPVARTSSPFAIPQPVPSAQRPCSAIWVCPICSYSNPVPSNFDAASANALTPLPPCLACGIKPPLAHVLKAAIANASGRSSVSNAGTLPASQSDQKVLANSQYGSKISATTEFTTTPTESRFRCPRCTFQNHPSLLACELCGSPLISAEDSTHAQPLDDHVRSESPGPSLDSHTFGFEKDVEGVKFSFRAGGEKIFYERLKGAMTQRKWLLQNAPPIPRPSQSSATGSEPFLDNRQSPRPQDLRPKVVGIAGLERRGLELRKNNETIIGTAFEDLEALMASAKEIVALAEQFAHQSAEKGSEGDAILAESATALGMVITKDMLGSTTASDSLYLSELSRNVAEYLTDDAKGVLRKEGGIMTLVDLWAVFNRTWGGVELISPADFVKAARLWDKLSLPVRLRQFRNGLLVVQRQDWTDDKTIAQLLAWLQGFHSVPVGMETENGWDRTTFGKGVTAQEAALQFGWSIGVASEELDMAEEKGALCREEGAEGVKYWENWIAQGDHDAYEV